MIFVSVLLVSYFSIASTAADRACQAENGWMISPRHQADLENHCQSASGSHWQADETSESESEVNFEFDIHTFFIPAAVHFVQVSFCFGDS